MGYVLVVSNHHKIRSLNFHRPIHASARSSLPEDLLHISYLEIAAPIDRLRFSAVCTAWRAVASSHLPSGLLPWLILHPSGGHQTNRVYCPEEGVVLPRLSLPGEAVPSCFVGSHDGGWVAPSEAPLMIINLFSGAEVPLPSKLMSHARQRRGDLQLVLRKIIFSEQPTLRGCIVAAITNMHALAFCKVGCPEDGWKIRGRYRLMDIAFCNGKLYGITTKELIKYEFGVNERGALELNSLCMLKIREGPDEHVRYITELDGNLVMLASNYPLCNNFRVYKLLYGYTNYMWVEVNSLGDYALFLGPTCSKSVFVPDGGGSGNMHKNHIYFSHHRCIRRNQEIPSGAKVFFTSLNDDGYRVCYYKQEESVINGVKGIMSTGYYAVGAVRPPMWTFPPDIYKVN